MTGRETPSTDHHELDTNVAERPIEIDELAAIEIKGAPTATTPSSIWTPAFFSRLEPWCFRYRGFSTCSALRHKPTLQVSICSLDSADSPVGLRVLFARHQILPRAFSLLLTNFLAPEAVWQSKE